MLNSILNGILPGDVIKRLSYVIEECEQLDLQIGLVSTTHYKSIVIPKTIYIEDKQHAIVKQLQSCMDGFLCAKPGEIQFELTEDEDESLFPLWTREGG